MYNISTAGYIRKVDIIMNQQEIINGLRSITKEKFDACKADIASIGKNHPTERGVLQLKAGIYNVASVAAVLANSEHPAEVMSCRFRHLVKLFPDLAEYHNGLSDEEKGKMEVSLHPELFMRVNFYNSFNNDLAQAEKDGDPQKIFKARIKKEVLDEILNMWREFRVQNDLFVFAFDDKEV